MIRKLVAGACLLLLPWLSSAAEDSRVIVAKELYAAFNGGDMPKILALFSPDVEFLYHGPSHMLPQAGTFSGRKGVEDFFSRIAENFEILEIGQKMYSVTDDIVLVPGWEKGISKVTGGQYTAHWVHLLTVRNRQIVRFEEITDSGAIAEALAPADPARGKAYYTTCIACHGVEGQGQPGMHAPRLTFQEPEYIVRQLRNFRQMVRGGPQDFYGWQMNGRALALPGDRALRDVAAYIDTLPDTYGDENIDGDVRAGESIYKSSCVACHGAEARGNPDMHSPALAGLAVWYQLGQLDKFSSGIRGGHSEDKYGGQMRAVMGEVQTEKEMKDVVSYILTLDSQERHR